jgi:hypothetical protein
VVGLHWLKAQLQLKEDSKKKFRLGQSQNRMLSNETLPSTLGSVSAAPHSHVAPLSFLPLGDESNTKNPLSEVSTDDFEGAFPFTKKQNNQ